jgi:peroxiredoxin-like protein
MQHKFGMNLSWSQGRNGTGNLTSTNLNTIVSIPREMNGPGIGTNPDEMLLGASATCYLITFAALLENAKIPVEALSMESEGFVDVTDGVFTYERIVHKPNVKVPHLPEREENLINRLAQKAEQTCMISKALKGNVQIECHLQIEQASDCQ